MTAQERNLVNQLITELQGKHAAFRKALAAMFIDLTEYDLRLCVMLKANLTTKEIASLLNITPDSVKKAKHRLRKKLGMKPQDTWAAMIRQLY